MKNVKKTAKKMPKDGGIPKEPPSFWWSRRNGQFLLHAKCNTKRSTDYLLRGKFRKKY